MTEPRRLDGQRIVLAHAGGLDTTVAIPWLAETYRAEIIAVTVTAGCRASTRSSSCPV